MKTNVTISLDGELVVEARSKGLRFSEFFNNALKTYLEMDDDAPEELDLEDKIVNVKARLMSLETEKKKIEEKNKRESIPFKLGTIHGE